MSLRAKLITRLIFIMCVYVYIHTHVYTHIHTHTHKFLHVKSLLLCPSLTLWTIGCQVPLAIDFSSQGYWSRLPYPPSVYPPDSGMEPRDLLCLLNWQATSLLLGPPGKPPHTHIHTHLHITKQEVVYNAFPFCDYCNDDAVRVNPTYLIKKPLIPFNFRK